MRHLFLFVLFTAFCIPAFAASEDEDNASTQHPTVKCTGVEPDDKTIPQNPDGSYDISEKECMDKKGTIVEPD